MAKPSVEAAKRLMEPDVDTSSFESVLSGYGEWEDQMGETDCPEGCYVEPDGVCPHDYLSAGRTAGVI